MLYTIRWQKYPAAELLLTHHADPDEGDRNHETPLMVAIYMDDTRAMQILLDHGAHLDRQENINGQTALILAFTLKRTACISLLIAHHPNLTLRDNNVNTALDYAKRYGRPDLLPVKRPHSSPQFRVS